ncbi:MAG: HYR domain-containing protein [Saprospirales bacterium]|nr:HYR domain-containing protein [Saprospirales bacterium]
MAFKSLLASGQASVIKWDGSSWTALGGFGISDGIAEYQSLAIAPDGTIYLAYRDVANGMKTTVLSWDGSSWMALGGLGISAGQANFQSLAVAPNSTPFVAYIDVPASSFLTVLEFDKGSVEVTLTVTDNAGNSASATANVLVLDNLPPSITCPADQDVNLDANCELVVPDLTGGATVDDNCPSTLTVTQSPTAGTALPSSHNLTHEVTLTVTDASGNSATCTVILTGKDVTPHRLRVLLIRMSI